MNRNRVPFVIVGALVVAAVAGGGAVAFFNWRVERIRVENYSAGLSEAFSGGAVEFSADVPSAAPGWVLVAVAAVALLVAVVVGVAGFVSGGTASVQNTDGVQ